MAYETQVDNEGRIFSGFREIREEYCNAKHEDELILANRPQCLTHVILHCIISMYEYVYTKNTRFIAPN